MKTPKETLQVAVVKSPYGLALIACGPKGICALMLGDNAKELRDDLRRRFPKAELADAGTELEPLLSKVLLFLESPKRGLDAALDLRGTDFQRRVWQALRKIPVGSTSTYSEIARRIGLPKAVRAVGTACGANPVAVLVPCHRVLTSAGKISGYRWGVERKRTLLEKEGCPGLSATKFHSTIPLKVATPTPSLPGRSMVTSRVRSESLGISPVARKE